jgi:chemotaxis protein CheD
MSVQERIVIGIGEIVVSSRAGTVLTTCLGSCVAVVILDPASRNVAMAHIVLPHSAIAPAKARSVPGHFADTGIPALLVHLRRNGASGSEQGYLVKLAGGASVMDPNNTFNIGLRNLDAIRAVLNQHGLQVVAEDVGGRMSRSVNLYCENGMMEVSSPGRPTLKL